MSVRRDGTSCALSLDPEGFGFRFWPFHEIMPSPSDRLGSFFTSGRCSQVPLFPRNRATMAARDATPSLANMRTSRPAVVARLVEEDCSRDVRIQAGKPHFETKAVVDTSTNRATDGTQPRAAYQSDFSHSTT